METTNSLQVCIQTNAPTVYKIFKPRANVINIFYRNSTQWGMNEWMNEWMKSLFLLSRTTFVNEKTDPVGCIKDNVLQMFITVCRAMYFSFK